MAESDAKYYRKMADDCARHADAVTSPKLREAWLDLHRQWVALAEKYESPAKTTSGQEPPQSKCVTLKTLLPARRLDFRRGGVGLNIFCFLRAPRMHAATALAIGHGLIFSDWRGSRCGPSLVKRD